MNNLLNNTYVSDVVRSLISAFTVPLNKGDIELATILYKTACETLCGLWISNACDDEIYNLLRDEISNAYLTSF